MSIELTVNGIKEIYCKKWVEYCIKDKDDPTKYSNRCKFNNRCKYKHHEKPICIFFAKNGNCRFGDRCKNIHPKEFEKEQEKPDYCITHSLFIKNNNFPPCRFGSDCKYAHGTSDLTLPKHIKIFNNLLETGKLPFNEINESIKKCLYDNFEVIADERKKAYVYFHIPDNFLEVINLWRELSTSYREWKRSCSKRLDMISKYKSGHLDLENLVDRSKSIQYIINNEGFTTRSYIKAKSYVDIIGDYCYCRNYPDYLTSQEIMDLPDLRPFDNEMKENVVNHLIIRTNVCIKDYNSYVYGVHCRNDICVHGIKCNNGIHFEDLSRDNIYSTQLNLNRLCSLDNDQKSDEEVTIEHNRLFDILENTHDRETKQQITKSIIDNLKSICVVEKYGYLPFGVSEQHVPTDNDFTYLVPKEEIEKIKTSVPEIKQLSQDEINKQEKIGSTLNNIFWSEYINQGIIRETFYSYSNFKLGKLKEKINKCLNKKIKLLNNPYLLDGLEHIGNKYNIYGYVDGIRKSFIKFETEENKEEYYDFWGYYNSVKKTGDPRFYGKYRSLINTELYDKYERTLTSKTFESWINDTNFEIANLMIDNDISYRTANVISKSNIDFNDVTIEQVDDNIGIVMDWVLYNGKNKGIKISDLIKNDDLYEWFTSNLKISFDDFMKSKDDGFKFISKSKPKSNISMLDSDIDKIKKNIGKYKKIIKKNFMNSWDNNLHSFYYNKTFNIRTVFPSNLKEAQLFIEIFEMDKLNDNDLKEILKVFPSEDIVNIIKIKMSDSEDSSVDFELDSNDSEKSSNDDSSDSSSDDSSENNDSDTTASLESDSDSENEASSEFDSETLNSTLTGSYGKFIREANYIYSYSDQGNYYIVIGPFYKKVEAKEILRSYKDGEDGQGNGKVKSNSDFHDIEFSYKGQPQYKRGLKKIIKFSNMLDDYEFYIDLL